MNFENDCDIMFPLRIASTYEGIMYLVEVKLTTLVPGLLGPAQAAVPGGALPQRDRGVQQTMFGLVVQLVGAGNQLN